MTDAPVRVFAAPGRYVQGPGALDLLGELLRPYGDRPFIVWDAPVRRLLAARLARVFAAAGLRPVLAELPGEITYSAVEELLDARGADADQVCVGIGGGKVLDAAKAVALRVGAPVVTVPSIASNDSPASGAVAMYDDDHVMISVDRLPRHPDLVLVDTRLVAEAPVEFLRCGIGDAIAKKFEADACAAGTGSTPVGGRPLRTAGAIADACYRTIAAHGVAALAACAGDQVTEELEAVVEAVVLMSGLGFENGGLSLAHGLTRGLVRARGASRAAHGRHVAWGLLVQLAAEGRPAGELAALIELHGRLGLPTSLAELGMPDPTGAEIGALAELTMAAPHVRNMPAPVDAAQIATAIRQVEELAVR
ncbi:glycerol dehydrogenase [uncultured Jatrophihabitans sp.]|uniref:glycerol dehydrogenase n=1 Tax=uncultured Jatrophihabitans sp. TaxID=1610747 RepID=UPI0035CA59B9